jgi:hypothetical protein
LFGYKSTVQRATSDLKRAPAERLAELLADRISTGR